MIWLPSEKNAENQLGASVSAAPKTDSPTRFPDEPMGQSGQMDTCAACRRCPALSMCPNGLDSGGQLTARAREGRAAREAARRARPRGSRPACAGSRPAPPRQACAKPALSQRQPAPRPALGMRLAPKCAHGATNGNRPLPRDLGPSQRMARAVDESGHRRADHGPIPCASQSRRTRD